MTELELRAAALEAASRSHAGHNSQTVLTAAETYLAWMRGEGPFR